MRLKRLALALIVVALIAVGLPSTAAQESAAYAARGPFTVGVRDLVIEGDPYPLNVKIWYPAISREGAEPATYDVLFFSLDGSAIRDADPDPAQAPYPLVVFSHGAGAFSAQSVFLTEHLASYGFVVIAADHPGNTIQDFVAQLLSPDSMAAFSGTGSDFEGQFGEMLISDEVREMMAANFALRPQAVLREINFAETLAAESGALAGMIDTEQTAVIGHSMGGYTALAAAGARLDFDSFSRWCSDPTGITFDPAADPAFVAAPFTAETDGQACYVNTLGAEIADLRGLDQVPAGLWPPTSDPRIQAAVVLAPYNSPVFGAEGLAALNIPLMVQVGSGDTIAVPERDAYAIYTQVSSTNKALVVFEGAAHMVFVDRQVSFLGGDPVWDMDNAQALISHFATTFLLSVLKNDVNAAAALAPAAVDFAGITYDRQANQ